MFTTYLLAFEVTSALLVVAVVGAVVLARRPRRGLEDDGTRRVTASMPARSPTARTARAGKSVDRRPARWTPVTSSWPRMTRSEPPGRR